MKPILIAHVWNVAFLSSLFWNSPDDELALENKLKSLESAWSSLDFWLDLWTLMVVIGVVVELVVIFIEYGHEKESFESGIIRPPDKPSRLLFALGMLGAGLVAIGVAGEFRVHIKAGRIETDLRGASGALVAIVDKKAADANERAAKIEQKLADRHITIEQRKRMLGILKSEAGTKIAVTFLNPSSTDAQEYSMEIGEVFHDAKWIVVSYPWQTSADTPVHGFAIEIRQKHPGFKTNSLERTTRKALSVLDDRIVIWPAKDDPNPQGTKLDLIIFVGSK
jgi:hypothetical protein